MTNSPAIEITDLTKRFGDGHYALSDLDLTVDRGEIYGFLGPNGAGKSTTINVLLDFVRPTSGTASVFGRDVQTASLDVRDRVGVLPDGFRFYRRRSGRDHVQFAIESKGANDDPDELLERVGILEAADRRATGYSKGMSQRLALAIALVGDPELLILDEPSTGLDPSGAREMREIILEENRRGATVFFSSHILEQVEAVCDRVGILHEGKLVAEDTVDGLRGGLGTGTVLEVVVSDATPTVLEAVRSVAGVTTVEADAETISIGLEGAQKMDVLKAIETNGSNVLDFATREASLEEVFTSYVAQEVVA
ncbi:MAG: ABC transporter ATP-binding protein [Halobacteriota archaeon]